VNTRQTEKIKLEKSGRQNHSLLNKMLVLNLLEEMLKKAYQFGNVSQQEYRTSLYLSRHDLGLAKKTVEEIMTHEYHPTSGLMQILYFDWLRY